MNISLPLALCKACLSNAQSGLMNWYFSCCCRTSGIFWFQESAELCFEWCAITELCKIHSAVAWVSGSFTLDINPLSTNLTKWSNTLKQFVGRQPTNCLSVFDHFVGLTRKGLKSMKTTMLVPYHLVSFITKNEIPCRC